MLTARICSAKGAPMRLTISSKVIFSSCWPAAAFAAERGIIIADTKFEFGLDANHQLILMDEILTADSSRFWPAETYQVGINPPSYDKQFIRDWLESILIDGKPWPKQEPAPNLPDEVINQTAEKYREVLARLTKT